MVILVGQATRLAQFLDKDKKEYEAIVRFGFETDTGDRTGSPRSKAQSSKSVSTEEVRAALDNFRGEIMSHKQPKQPDTITFDELAEIFTGEPITDALIDEFKNVLPKSAFIEARNEGLLFNRARNSFVSGLMDFEEI